MVMRWRSSWAGVACAGCATTRSSMPRLATTWCGRSLASRRSPSSLPTPPPPCGIWCYVFKPKEDPQKTEAGVVCDRTRVEMDGGKSGHGKHLDVARRVLSPRSVLRRLYLCFVLMAFPAIAWGQAVPQAETTVKTDEQKVAQLGAQRGTVAQRYQDQLATVDRLKKQKASWRRDRELRESLADSADTANQLASLNTQLAAATRALIQARKDLVAAID